MQDQLSDIQTVLNKKASEMTLLQNTLLQELANIHLIYKDLSLSKKTLTALIPQLDFFRAGFRGLIDYCLGQLKWFSHSITCLSQHLLTLNNQKLYEQDGLKLQLQSLSAQIQSKDKRIAQLQSELSLVRSQRRLVLKQVEQPSAQEQKSKRKQMIIKKLNQQIQKDVQRFKLDRERTPERSRYFK